VREDRRGAWNGVIFLQTVSQLGAGYEVSAGSIENRNGILRRFFPKKHDWRLTKKTELDKVLRKSLFKIWNFGVADAKILPCRL
jgi:hypothetical protein